MLSLLRKKKKKEDLTVEQSLGNLHEVPNHVIVMNILIFLQPAVILRDIARVNTRFNSLCCNDELWKQIIQDEAFTDYMRVPATPPMLSFYKNFRTYWRLNPFKEKGLEKKFYALKEGNMVVSGVKSKKIKNTKNIKPILTENRILKGCNQIFRILLPDENLSGSSVVIADKERILLNYHHDGSISRSHETIAVDNRIQEIEEDDGSKKNVKIMYPFEKKFVLNVFIEYEVMKIHFFFNENLEERITCSVTRPEIFDSELYFGLKVNFGQEIRILPSHRSFKIEYPNRKKFRRIYKI